MTPEQKKLARHALGLDNSAAKGRSYRNRYFSHAGNPEWVAMVEAGEATVNGPWFHLTRSGAEAALNPREKLDPEDFPERAKVGEL